MTSVIHTRRLAGFLFPQPIVVTPTVRPPVYSEVCCLRHHAFVSICSTQGERT